ncbi:MAG: Glycosidase PH1107-related protein [Parcubacteria bacterium C7867-007]|nr:MAG: Glycosidase PH1107-related protein [Parcubacteria bacterium C7867-007]
MNSSLILFFIVVLIAFFVTGLFIYGVWNVIRSFAEKANLIQAIIEALRLGRSGANPILKKGPYEWEAQSVLNPAAVEVDGKTHMFYRAIGNDGVSRIGYASSKDGTDFDERLPYPVFAGEQLRAGTYRYDPVLYPSGGSWGGTEDPRAVIIDGIVYLTFNMFDGWDNMRVMLTTLSVEDLKAKRWNWSTPTYLSPQGQRHKNWVLFPEKINGKFAILHNLHTEDPDHVRVDYVDDPRRIGTELPTIESADPNALPDRPVAWHKRMRSAGPPPLKTDAGWLLLYHGTDEESHKYKMGAALLDLNDPTKIIARAPLPVLVPDASYENEGKPGIVYGCGATITDDTLRVYYGGGDNVICTASAHLPTFLKTLIGQGAPKLATP